MLALTAACLLFADTQEPVPLEAKMLAALEDHRQFTMSRLRMEISQFPMRRFQVRDEFIAARKEFLESKRRLKALEKFEELAIPTIRLQRGYWGTMSTVEVQQVIDDSTLMARIKDESFIITGVSTKGIVDDRRVDLPGLFISKGTRQYITVLGAKRTVLEYTPCKVNEQEWLDAMKAAFGDKKRKK